MPFRRRILAAAVAAGLASVASAQRIELRRFDGEPVQGELMGFERGSYTLRTASGVLNVPEAQVVDVRILSEGTSFGRDRAARSPEQLPSTAAGCYDFAQTQRKFNHLDVAKAALEKAVAIDPSFLAGYVALGETCLDLENFAGAEETAQKALSLNPMHEGANELYARYLERVGRPGEAAEWRIRQTGRSFSEPEASYRIAHAWLTAGNLEKAAEAWKAYLAKDPDQQGAFNVEARAMRDAADLYAQNHWLDGVERLRAALRENSLLSKEAERQMALGLDAHLRSVEAHPDPVAALNDVYALLQYDAEPGENVLRAAVAVHAKAAARIIAEQQIEAMDRFLARMDGRLPEPQRREVLASVAKTLQEALERNPASRAPARMTMVLANHVAPDWNQAPLRAEIARLLIDAVRRSVGAEPEDTLVNWTARAMQLIGDPAAPAAAPFVDAVRPLAARAIAADLDGLAGKALDILAVALPKDPNTLALRSEREFGRVRRNVQTARNAPDAVRMLDEYLSQGGLKPEQRSWAEAQKARLTAPATGPGALTGTGADLATYFPLEKGRFWVYEHENGDRDRITLAGIGPADEESAKSALFTLEGKIPDVQFRTSYRRFADDLGVYLLEEDGKVYLLRRPLTPGSRWVWEAGPITYERRIVSSDERVTLPSGQTFERCLVVEFKSTHNFNERTLTHTTTEAYAPGVGLIQSIFTPGDASTEKTRLDLVSYGKED